MISYSTNSDTFQILSISDGIYIMNEPEIFFILRCAEHNGKWHFYCIEHNETANHDRDRDRTWDVFDLNENRCITLSIPQSETDYLEGFGTQPVEVYGRDSAIDIHPVRQRVRLFVAQHGIFLVTEQNCSNLTFPCFVSVVPSTPVCHIAVVEFASGLLIDLPEVSIDLPREQAEYAEYNDMGLFLKKTDDTFRIPEWLFLPASIESGSGNKSPGVYRIEKWLSEKTAIVECHQADDSVPFATGSKLTRRVFTPNGEEFSSEIGTVLEVK